MKKFLTLLILASVATSACAFKCTRWIDKEGIERVKCDHSQPLRNVELVEKEFKYPTDVKFIGLSKDSDSFTVFDNTNHIMKNCVKMHGRIDCR